jgi:uncharacterized YigZ family protein
MDLFDDTYKELEAPTEGFFKDRGSKFIARVYPVHQDEEIKTHLQELRSEYYDARHHCYSWIIGPDQSAYRINDDGEPSGSAGKPIHGQLLSHGLTNTLAVVVRYFGGTKLGIPGLINAYREATRDALAHGNIIELTVNETYHIQYEYPLMDVVMRFMKDHDINIIKTQFELDCRLSFEVRKSQAPQVVDSLKQIYGITFQKD